MRDEAREASVIVTTSGKESSKCCLYLLLHGTSVLFLRYTVVEKKPIVDEKRREGCTKLQDGRI